MTDQEPRPATQRDETSPVTFEIPKHFFGDLTNDFYAGIGRTAVLSALLEDRFRTLLQAMTHKPQTAHSKDGATALIKATRGYALSLGNDWTAFDRFAERTESAFELRNDLVHNLWQPKPGGQFFGHRINRQSGISRTKFVSIDEVRDEVAELVTLNREWRHWHMLAGALPFEAG